MLAQLKDIHAELHEAIAALQAETSRPMPQGEELAAARLRLTRLSSRRYSLIEGSILPHLRDVCPDDARKVAGLRLESAALRVRSSEHIGRWTMRTIPADWAGYQRASAAMLAGMLRRIAAEEAILYPLLTAKDAQRAA